MRIDVNLDEAQVDFEALPAGNYEVEVKKCTRFKGDAGPCLRWQLHPIGGKGLEELEKPGDLFVNTSLAPQALFNLINFLKACGFEWEPKGFDTDDVIGSTLEVAVVQQEYKGRMGNQVEEFLPL